MDVDWYLVLIGILITWLWILTMKIRLLRKQMDLVMVWKMAQGVMDQFERLKREHAEEQDK